MYSPKSLGGPCSPPSQHFGQIKEKSALPPPTFFGQKGQVKVTPLTFQKGDYIPYIAQE